MAEIARKLEGTIYVTPLRESVDGQMTTCGLEFSAMKMDFSTKGGAPGKIVGSFSLPNSAIGGLFYALKIGIIDRLGANPCRTS